MADPEFHLNRGVGNLGNYYKYLKNIKTLAEFEAEEMKRVGKNPKGGTGFKMSEQKRKKNHLKRK